MLIRIEKKNVEEAVERVRRKRGDKSRTATVELLILEADGSHADEVLDGHVSSVVIPPRVAGTAARRKARKVAK
jgi:hypothetical protein